MLKKRVTKLSYVILWVFVFGFMDQAIEGVLKFYKN